MAHATEVAVTLQSTEPMARSPAAERMRHHRERRRLGLRCIVVQVFEKEVDTLVRRGLLKADARNDPFAIREALHKHFSLTLRPTP